METTIQRVSIPDNHRILMISDIHGHADGLRALLKQVNYQPGDVLILVGDYLEKGPQSLETLREVMALCRAPNTYALMGNVELWRLEYLQSREKEKWKEFQENSIQAKAWWGSSLLHEMCGEIGVSLTEKTEIEALFPTLQAHFAPEIKFIATMPSILETQRMIFVHGGIPHERLEELQGTDAFPLLKFDDFYRSGLSFEKYVIVGHWPTVLYSKTYPVFDPIIDRERHIVCLDGACGVKKEGQLNLVSLPDWRSEDFSFTAWQDLPEITALDAQASSPPEEARYIPWNDHAVQMLEEGEEMSRILYHGKPMDVPTQFIFYHHGLLSCSDVTDYVLSVQPGDSLHLILSLRYGCYVKKGSVSGWYFGRYEKKDVTAL